MSDTPLTVRGQRVSLGGRMTAQLMQATFLDFDNCQVDDDVLPRLAEVGRIISIRMYDCPIGDGIFDSIAKLPGLKQLRLRRCGISTAGLLRLTGHCLGLTVCELMDEPLVDDGIMPLIAQFSDVRTLCLRGTGLVNPDLSLPEVHLPPSGGGHGRRAGGFPRGSCELPRCQRCPDGGLSTTSKDKSSAKAKKDYKPPD